MSAFQTRLSVHLRTAAALSIAVATGAVALHAWDWRPDSTAPAVCPPGYELKDPAAIARKRDPGLSLKREQELHAKFGPQVCVAQLMERLGEADAASAADRFPVKQGATAAALRAAVTQKAALMGNQAKVANADGAWQPYGKGVLEGDLAYPGGFERSGIHTASGLTADIEYDATARRMFAAVSSGGVWMSEATGGDVATLGDLWTDIGRSLPTQATAHVSWTPAGGGTLLVLTGEHTLDGGAFESLGVYWTTDLGQTWNHADGIPDGGPAFHMAVDQSKPGIVYAATGRGLYRSIDAGRSFVNVMLPTTPDCAGVTDPASKCIFANMVTDVVVQVPGGSSVRPVTCGDTGCPVLAAVGWKDGAALHADGTPHSTGNGLYRSDTGEPGTFAKLAVSANTAAEPVGFAPQANIGRVELGAATGPAQDHNFVYAIVHDAVRTRGGVNVIDMDDPRGSLPPDVAAMAACANLPISDPTIDLLGLNCAIFNGIAKATAFNGIYASPDFGTTWIRLADEVEITYNPTTNSTLHPLFVNAGYGPGVQSAYNMWVTIDPTQADPATGIPTRMAFGLEEVFMNRAPLPLAGVQQTPNDFQVIGAYFAGSSCFGLTLEFPGCPYYQGVLPGPTTHPDQHDGLFVPDDNGGVWLFAANDGGVYKQYSADPATDPFANPKWNGGSNQGFNTLMIYGFGVSADGTVYMGLQDNGSAKIDPATGRVISFAGGDGVFGQADPKRADIGYYQTPGLSLKVTSNGGVSGTTISPAAGAVHFTSPFMLDPTDSKHLVAAGSLVVESIRGSGTTSDSWVTVFDLGKNETTGNAHQSRLRALDVEGANAYVGWCTSPCNLYGAGGQPFERGLATNVGGDKPPRKAKPDGWHQASLNGLPNRYISGIEIDAADPNTVYVTLGGYSLARWLPPGQYGDTNPNIGRGHVYKSTDAGESFTDISGNLPDVNVISVLVRGSQIIVGTDLGAFISSDLNGSDWAPMGDLPNISVNQLALNPADSRVLYAATYGRGMWKYEFADAVPARASSDSQGRGLFLGAFSPLLLAVAVAAALRRRVRRGRIA